MPPPPWVKAASLATFPPLCLLGRSTIGEAARPRLSQEAFATVFEDAI